jgi:phospholipase/carboxylesterase
LLVRLRIVSILTRQIVWTALVLGALGVLFFWQFAPRPERFGLATIVDGPAPSAAAGVVVFLHGLGQGYAQGEDVARRLRSAGLTPNISIVIVRAPYRFGLFGFSWGDTPEERAQSRARLRSVLSSLHAQGRVAIAGFSQGATLALDTAAEEPRIGAVASFSPCYSENRGQLPGRNLRFLLAHGTRDTSCPVEESRSLAKVLETMNRPVRYIEFDGKHEMPREVIEALVKFVAP